MAGWSEWLPCGNCGADLPERGWKRRRVPRRGGKRMKICADCAQQIDAQVTLAEADGRPLGERRVA